MAFGNQCLMSDGCHGYQMQFFHSTRNLLIILNYEFRSGAKGSVLVKLWNIQQIIETTKLRPTSLPTQRNSGTSLFDCLIN